MQSAIDVVMNVPGDFVASSEEIAQVLIDQVVSPVRWEKGIRADDGAAGSMSISKWAPARTLSGMNKRIGVAEPTYSVEKVADLEELKKLMESYATVER